MYLCTILTKNKYAYASISIRIMNAETNNLNFTNNYTCTMKWTNQHFNSE